MWLANMLTLVRIPLAALFWVSYGHVAWSLAIVAVAALTDAFDGRVARRARARSGRAHHASAGEWLDPLADKIFVIVALAAAVGHGASVEIACAVVAREIVLVPLAIVYRVALVARPRVDHAFQADALGKVTTIVQLVAVTAIIGRLPGAAPLAFAAAGLGLLAAAHYIARATTAMARLA